MNLTRYNPNLDRGITTQPNISGLRVFDGEDLCKLYWRYKNDIIRSKTSGNNNFN
jgi:hypothetical protein